MVTRISESTELPITTGTIEVDTSQGGVTIFMKSGPVHGKGETLTITKVSRDHHLVSLFGENSLVNGNEIVIFGVPGYIKAPRGKVSTLVMKCDGHHWRILREE